MSWKLRQFDRRSAGGYALAGLAVVYLVVWHGSVFVDLARVWQTQPENSAGMLVPIVAGWLLIARRRKDDAPVPVGGWLALGLLAAAVGLRWLATSVFVAQIAAATAVVALVVTVLGAKASRRSVGPIVLLYLAVPLPDAFVNRVTAPLQGLATSAAVSCLVLLGEPVVQDGNSILLGETPVSVTAECDGPSMITGLLTVHAFVALSGSFGLWSKLAILAASVPMALFANTLRVLATSLAFRYWSMDLVRALFHDAAGWLMMPFALGILYGVIALIGRVRRGVAVPAG